MASYGHLNLQQLKQELKSRGAKTSGRKRELVERLEAYNRNADFRQEIYEEEDQLMEVLYSDVTSQSEVPVISRDIIRSFLKLYHVTDIPDSGILMYHNEHLTSLRTCYNEKGFYFRAVCRAQFRKQVIYKVDVLLNKYGEILESQCD